MTAGTPQLQSDWLLAVGACVRATGEPVPCCCQVQVGFLAAQKTKTSRQLHRGYFLPPGGSSQKPIERLDPSDEEQHQLNTLASTRASC